MSASTATALQAARATAGRLPLAGRSSVVELQAPKGDPFDLSLSVDGVWNLRRGLIGSYLIERGGVAQHTDPAELEEIDVATFAYAAVLLEEQTEQDEPLTLHLPVSFLSLATQRSRVRLMSLTHSVRDAMRTSVLLEICGLDGGVPPSRLTEIVALFRSMCIGVIGRVEPTKAALNSVQGCGLRGLVVEAERLSPHRPDFEARLAAFVAMARPVSPNLLIHGLPDLKQIDLAAEAGFSLASAVARLDYLTV